VVGRNTQGVRIIRLKDNEHLVGLARIAEPEEEDNESGGSAETTTAE
jgi:DNA gyrase subunit A